MNGPCVWPIQYTECVSGGDDESLPEAIGDLSPEQRERVEKMAVEFLWNWTGRGLGLCEISVRPCRTGCPRPATYYGQPGLMGGSRVAQIGPGSYWLDYACGCPTSRCRCGTGPESVRLPGPIDEITEVRVGGEVLPESAYRVDNRSLLVRTDGEIWPMCQDMTADGDQPGTWEVTYTYGIPVPVGGEVAAGVLAEEMAKALCNDGSCRLPERVQTVTRQGVTMAMLDMMEDVEKGRTGLWLVDSWISSVMAPRPRSSVLSPDLPRPKNRVTTWT